MATHAPDERQRPSRLPFIRFITYERGSNHTREADDRGTQAAAINVSDGGLCLLVNEPINEADILRVDLPLADVSTSSPTLAEVKWSMPTPWSGNGSPQFFIGVQFLL